MIRSCFLVVDREYAGSISTRKLVIESAKRNVITAYSGAEAIETLKKFPKVDGIVIDAEVNDVPLEELIEELKRIDATIPLVLVRSPGSKHSSKAEYEIESFDPVLLLRVLEELEPSKP